MDESAKSNRPNHGYQLILPDLSGIAKIVDDFTLPSIDSSLRELVSEHDKHNQKVQQLIVELEVDNGKLKVEVNSLNERLNNLTEKHEIMVMAVEMLTEKIDQLTKIYRLDDRSSKSKSNKTFHFSADIVETETKKEEHVITPPIVEVKAEESIAPIVWYMDVH